MSLNPEHSIVAQMVPPEHGGAPTLDIQFPEATLGDFDKARTEMKAQIEDLFKHAESMPENPGIIFHSILRNGVPVFRNEAELFEKNSRRQSLKFLQQRGLSTDQIIDLVEDADKEATQKNIAEFKGNPSAEEKALSKELEWHRRLYSLDLAAPAIPKTLREIRDKVENMLSKLESLESHIRYLQKK